jgi:serine/threonine protein phosphatase PrpC
MALQLVDSLSLPGDPMKPNEDAFGHADGAAVVLDGATPLGDMLMPGSSDAAWIAHFGSRRLLSHIRNGSSPRKALRNALNDAEESFKGLRRRAPDAQWEMPCASMFLAVETMQARPPLARSAGGVSEPESPKETHGEIECLWYGDCGALLANDNGVEVIGETMSKRAAEAKRASTLAKMKNVSPANALSRGDFISQLRKARDFVNSGNYWLFSPEVTAAPHATRLTLRAAPGAHLLLASDGFLALASDYAAYDVPGLMAAALEKGLAALGEELRAIEAADPGGDKYPRFKKSDDATAVLLKVA